MKSFLKEIDDVSLCWTTDDENGDSTSYCTSSYTSSDEDEGSDNERVTAVEVEMEMEQAAPPNGLIAAERDDNFAGNRRAGGEAEGDAVAIIGDRLDSIYQDQQEQHPVNVVPPAAPPAANNRNQIMHTRTNNSVNTNLRNHPQSATMLFRVARCEELPLVRAEINWTLLQNQIPSYPAAELGDESGSHLLQSSLRTDPPCEVIRDIIKQFPKSCVNMDSFYAACQHASDDAVQLLMRLTMKARETEGISWGMLAFLGDWRIRTRHAQFLLQSVPKALVDPMHGVFEVSPLDRMVSGAFIHGVHGEWVEKLKLALWTAEKGSLSEWGNYPFYPFHALVKRLISSDFMGVKFGALSFVHSLTACVKAETNNKSQPFHQLDEKGNLPLHTALQSDCDTNLSRIGERKLIKFLLRAHPESAMIRDTNGKLPIILAIEHGWPVHDIIVNACPKEYIEGDIDCKKDLLLHDILRCKFHQRLGISGARSLIKSLLKKYPSSVESPSEEGRMPLHLAIENGWPCHDLLVGASPSALEVRDPKTNFHPFLLATSAKIQGSEEKKSLIELSMLYELIKWGPLLLKNTSSDDKVLKRKLIDNDSHGPPMKRVC